GAPSPMDRIRATKFAVECVSFLEKHAKSSGLSDNPRVYTKDKKSAAVIVINGAQVVCTPVTDLLSDTKFEFRKGYADNEPIEEEMNIRNDFINLRTITYRLTYHPVHLCGYQREADWVLQVSVERHSRRREDTPNGTLANEEESIIDGNGVYSKC
ncbi:10141_t:CDS:2, partial [Racocetra persica]